MIAIISRHISETSLRVGKVPEEYEPGAQADVDFNNSLLEIWMFESQIPSLERTDEEAQ
jgi:hypothetical protein